MLCMFSKVRLGDNISFFPLIRRKKRARKFLGQLDEKDPRSEFLKHHAS